MILELIPMLDPILSISKQYYTAKHVKSVLPGLELIRLRLLVSINLGKEESMLLRKKHILWLLITVCNTALIPAKKEAPKKAINSISFKKLYTIKGHKDIVQSMKILKNGQLISGSADTTMRTWSMDGACTKHLYNHAGWINSVEELADGRIACGSNDHIINLWDAKNGTYTTLSNLEKEHIYADALIQLSSEGIAFSTWKGAIKIWDIDKDVCLKTIDTDQHKAWISSLIELKTLGCLATSSWDGTIKMWALSQDKSLCLKTFEGHTDCVNVVRQLNDKTLVSAGDDSTIIVWDIDSGVSKATLCGHSDRVYALLVVNDKIISGSRDKTVKIWDPTLQHCIATIPCEERVYSLAFSPKEQYLFVGLAYGDIEVFQLFFS
jgi:WD40 repeat protein